MERKNSNLVKLALKKFLRPLYLPVYNRCIAPVLCQLTEFTYKVDSRIRKSEENILKTLDERIRKSEENTLNLLKEQT